jgi:hypothetical protein
VSWWHTGLIALGSAALGGGLTGAAAWMVFIRQERAALARDVRIAIGNYFGALVLSVAELRRAPENPPDTDLMRRITESAPDAVKKWFAAQRWINTEKGMRQVLGPQPYANIERVVLAYAHLQILPLPPAVGDALTESLDYVEQLAASRSAEVKERWPQVRDALLAALREYVVDPDELARALRQPVASSTEGVASSGLGRAP